MTRNIVDGFSVKAERNAYVIRHAGTVVARARDADEANWKGSSRNRDSNAN